jgi:hypothetical protein
MNRHTLSVVALLVLSLLGGWQLVQLFSSSRVPLLHDYLEYWAAGRLNLNGQNPYSPALLRELQQAAGLEVDMAIVMWNPPWTLTLVMPFGLFEPRPGQILWILLQLVFVLFCADRLWLKFGGDSHQRWLGWLLGVSFAPTAFLLGTGQIAGFCLLGLTGFLLFEKKHPLVAGMFAALTAIKPHLLVVFAVLLIREGFRSGHGRKILLGGLIVGLIAATIPLLTNPQVYAQYREVLTAPSSSDHKSLDDWKHPTLGSWLRVLAEGPFWLQLLPCLVVGIYALLRIRLDSPGDWTQVLPGVVFLSFLGSPYGSWPFDLVLLLVPMLATTIEVIRTRQRSRIIGWFCCWLLLNGILLLKLFAGVSTPYYVWVVPTFFAMDLLFRRGGPGLVKALTRG